MIDNSLRKEASKMNKQTLIKLMKENGIGRIDLKFDGSGDEGQIEELIMLDENKKVIDNDSILELPCELVSVTTKRKDDRWNYELETKQENFRYLAEMVSYDPLEDAYDGWEINEGAYGTVSIHADGSGSIECNQRVIEIVTEHASFTL